MSSSNEYVPESEELKFLREKGEPTVELGHEISFEILQASQIQKAEILNFGDEGFLLKGLLAAEECKQFVSYGEKLGFNTMYGYAKNYRNNTRIMIHSERLAELLWTRVESYLNPIVIEDDPRSVHVSGSPAQSRGTWLPSSINPVNNI